MEVYVFLSSHKDILSLDDDVLKDMLDIIKNKTKHDNIFILNPDIDIGASIEADQAAAAAASSAGGQASAAGGTDDDAAAEEELIQIEENIYSEI